MNILGLIPARGGSKGVPRKNIRPLGGKPVLQYTAEAALGSAGLYRVVLSTDDEEIAEVGRACGLDVPFMRPADLAADASPTLPVMKHAVEYVEASGDRVDAICLLQPTNPMRSTGVIDACLGLYEKVRADCVITVLPVPDKCNPHWVYFRDDDGALRLSTGEATPIPRRQDLPPAFHREGSVYITRRDVLMKQSSLFGELVVGYEIDPHETVNIDSLEDFERAERMMAARRMNA